jgi:hypothetical protein
MGESIGVKPGTDAAEIIDAVLEGGPVDLPTDLRRHRIDATDGKIKVLHGGGYEHFERDDSGAIDGGALVFRWTGRTRVAE